MLYHVDEHFARPAHVRTLAYIDIAASVIEPHVPLHAPVRIKAELRQGCRRDTLVREPEKSLAEAKSLATRHHSDTVDEQVVGMPLKHEHAGRLAIDIGQPDLALFDPAAVILVGRLGCSPDDRQVGRDVGFGADGLDNASITPASQSINDPHHGLEFQRSDNAIPTDVGAVSAKPNCV